jgi:hypothetical protein
VRFLNPIRVRIEQRHAGEIQFIGSEGAGPPIRELQGR